MKESAAAFYESAFSDGIIYEANCTMINQYKWDKLMNGHIRANKQKVYKLLRKYMPQSQLLWGGAKANPYNCYRTDTHIILVHSAIEHFFRIRKPYYK